MTASTGLRRQWRESKSSPDTGKLSARPAGKLGCLLVEESLRRSLLRHSLAAVQRTILGAQYAFWKAWAESFWSDGVSTSKPNPGVGPDRLPLVGPRPR